MEKNLPPTSGDADSVPGSRRSPGKENDNPVQYSCLGNPMDRGAWQATVLGVTENQTCLINGVRTCAHPPPQHTHTCVYMQKKKENNEGESLPQGRVAIGRSTPVHGAHSAAWRLEREPLAAVSPDPRARAFPALLLSLPCPSPPVAPFTRLPSPVSEPGSFAPSAYLPVIAGLRCLNGSARLEPG